MQSKSNKSHKCSLLSVLVHKNTELSPHAELFPLHTIHPSKHFLKVLSQGLRGASTTIRGHHESSWSLHITRLLHTDRHVVSFSH